MNDQTAKNRQNLIRIGIAIGILSLMIIVATICLLPRSSSFTQTLEMTKVDRKGNYLDTVEVTVEVTETRNVLGTRLRKLSFAPFDDNRAFVTTDDDFQDNAADHYLFAANKVYISLDPNEPGSSLNAYIHISYDYGLWLIHQYQPDGSSVFYVADTSGQKSPAAIRTYFSYSTSY